MKPKTGPGAAAPVAAPVPLRRNRSRLAAYGLLGLGSLGLFLHAISLPSSKWEPLGAGTFPAIILLLLAGLCLLGAIQEARERREAGPELAALVRSHRLVIFTFAAFAIYVAVLPFAGFGLSTLAFLLAVQLGLAPGTWRARAIAFGLALVFSFGIPWLFAEAFGIFLPRASLFG